MVKDHLERSKDFDAVMFGAFPNLVYVKCLKAQMEKIGFFTAPASAHHHGNYAGGLFDHSYAVTKALIDLTERLDLKWELKRSPYIVGMFHDLCKVNQYTEQEDGTFEYNKEQTLNGHGEKSIMLLQKYMDLTEEELLCIRWHMGAFDDQKNWNLYTRAVQKYPNVLYAHTADMIASQIWGV